MRKGEKKNPNAFPSNASSEMHTHKLFSGNSEQRQVEEAYQIIKYRCAQLTCWASGLSCIMQRKYKNGTQVVTGILKFFAVSLWFVKVIAHIILVIHKLF